MELDVVDESELCSNDESQKMNFQLVQVSIKVYGLSGLLCRNRQRKKKKVYKYLRNCKNTTPSTITKDPQRIVGINSAESALSSKQCDYINKLSYKKLPLFAAVSIQRNISSSQTAMETFLPSLPIKLNSYINKRNRLSACWQSQTSFQLLRMMCKQHIELERYETGFKTNYIHEIIDLRISLLRGAELIPIGVANLVVGGEEDKEVIMNVPVKALQSSHFINIGADKDKIQSKRIKKARFSSDSSKKFLLDENAILRVGVTVNPHDVERISMISLSEQQKCNAGECRDNEDKPRQLYPIFEGGPFPERLSLGKLDLQVRPGTTAKMILESHVISNDAYMPKSSLHLPFLSKAVGKSSNPWTNPIGCLAYDYTKAVKKELPEIEVYLDQSDEKQTQRSASNISDVSDSDSSLSESDVLFI